MVAKNRRNQRWSDTVPDLQPQSQGTKFDRPYIEPAAPMPTSPRPHGSFETAAVEKIAAAVADAWADRSREARRACAQGVEMLLEQLSRFPGDTWQDRWLASGLDSSGQAVRSLVDPPSATLTTGLRTLFCLRVIRPSFIGFRSNKFSGYPEAFRESQHDPGLEAFFQHVEQMSDLSRHYQVRAQFDVCRQMTIQDITFAEITPASMLHFAYEVRRLSASAGAGKSFGSSAAWSVLHSMGHFPTNTPPTLRTAVYRGQLTTEELVDRYEVANPEVRQLLIDYLGRRRAEMDYSSLDNLSRHLTSTFWKRIEAINPGQTDLALSQTTYEQWRASINVRNDGKPRTDVYPILLAVRGFYLDLQTWATHEPETWARWAVPSPLMARDLSGHGVNRRRVKERMDDRTRVRQPLLPALAEHVEAQHRWMAALLGVAADTELGGTFTHEGIHYRRTSSTFDRVTLEREDTAPVRVERIDTGALIHVSQDEDTAFWRWATIETLRHTGMRIEELAELTHLSIRQYQRPNGEVIALLVVAPSKSDRERVIPMSAELFHVIARVVARHTSSGRPIPLLTRYDEQERTWSDPMPFLFQRQTGTQRAVISKAGFRKMLDAACRELAEVRPGFKGKGFTPHDFRRLFATEVVNSGLPIHIGAALLGHLSVETTRGYVAVFDEDVVRHYMQFLNRRRTTRPADEYREVTTEEWSEFEAHFDKRKVELGGCARPYGTPCRHEHACIRCPQLNINPKMLPRLDELEADLHRRRAHAETEGWIGELEGLDLTLTMLQQKREQAQRIARIDPVDLGIPTITPQEPTR